MKIKYIIFGIIIFSALGFLKPSKMKIYPPAYKPTMTQGTREYLTDKKIRENETSTESFSSGSGGIGKLAGAIFTSFMVYQGNKFLEEKARAERIRKEQYPDYSSILYSTKDFRIVEKKGKRGVVSNTGRKIVSIKYNSIRHKTFGNQEFFLASLYGKTAIYNKLGVLVAPLKNYENLKYIDELLDFLIVDVGNKRAIYSLYNRKKEVVPPHFEDIGFIVSSNGIGNYFLTKNMNKVGLYSENGDLLFDNKFDEINYLSLGNNSQYSNKKNDFFVVKYGNYKGLYDNDGKNIIPSIYNDIKKISENSNNKIAVMVVEKNNKKGLYNLDTRERLLPPIYDEINSVNFYDFDGFNYRKVKINVLINGKQKEKKIRLNSQGKMN